MSVADMLVVPSPVPHSFCQGSVPIPIYKTKSITNIKVTTLA